MENNEYDFIIVGSGAGGATVAFELTKKGNKVLILERGDDIKNVGTFYDILNFYDCNRYTKIPKKSNEGVIIYRTFMAGGTTEVATGNAVRCFEKEFKEKGIDLRHEFDEAEKELKIKPSSNEIQSEGSQAVYKAAKSLGYKMEPMPKVIDEEKCINCGMCIFGCAQRAKWTAKDFLQKAVDLGAEIKYRSKVEEVIIDKNKAIGVKGKNNQDIFEYNAGKIILAAGGLGTPIILLNSKLNNPEIGENLYIDTFVNIYGLTESVSQANEPPMEFVDTEFHRDKGFILSTFINRQRMIRFIEAGTKGMRLPTNRLIGMMCKIADTPKGKVYRDGRISKTVSKEDQEKLKEGIRISKEILEKAGADKNHFIISNPQGAHPGGTAALGKVVNKNLKTEIDNLYICDASIFHNSPGMPPILTIIALAKRLAKQLG